MIRRGYPCGDTFEEVFSRFVVDEDTETKIRTILKSEGYSERGICYGAGCSEQKLTKFIGDSRFLWVFVNEVRKNANKPGQWPENRRRYGSNNSQAWD